MPRSRNCWGGPTRPRKHRSDALTGAVDDFADAALESDHPFAQALLGKVVAGKRTADEFAECRVAEEIGCRDRHAAWRAEVEQLRLVGPAALRACTDGVTAWKSAAADLDSRLANLVRALEELPPPDPNDPREQALTWVEGSR